MPVAVLGAEQAIGRAVARATVRDGADVRAGLELAAPDSALAALRGIGVHATRVAADEDDIAPVVTGAHTVVLLGRGPLADPAAHRDALAAGAIAALDAGCARVVLVTELAAGSDNPYLAACRDAEALVAELPLEAVVLRCAVRYGDGDALAAALAATDPADLAADPATQHAPLHVDDVGEAVAVVDRSRDEPDLAIDVELVGPDEVTLGELHRRLRTVLPDAGRPDPGPDPGADPAADPAAGAGPLPSWVVDWLSRPATGSAQALGRSSGTRLAAGLAAR